MDDPKSGGPLPPLSWFQSLARAVAQRLQLRTVPPLATRGGADGHGAGWSDVKPIMAQIEGSASPYSWTEVYRTGPHSVQNVQGGRSGTSNAYELNATAHLGGSIAELWPGAAGTDYDFQFVPTCTPPPPPCGASFQVNIACEYGCTDNVTAITIKDPNGTTIATCPPFTPNDPYTGCGPVTCTVAGNYTITATVVGSGCCGNTETYTYTWTYAITAAQIAQCRQVTALLLICAPATIFGGVIGCSWPGFVPGGGPLPGATVTVKANGTTIGTTTTDAGGNWCLSITEQSVPPPTYTVTISATGFQSQTITVPVSASCAVAAGVVTLLPDGSHCCGCPSDSNDFPSTLFLSSSVGSATLTFNPGGGLAAQGAWQGYTSFSDTEAGQVQQFPNPTWPLSGPQFLQCCAKNPSTVMIGWSLECTGTAGTFTNCNGINPSTSFENPSAWQLFMTFFSCGGYGVDCAHDATGCMCVPYAQIRSAPRLLPGTPPLPPLAAFVLANTAPNPTLAWAASVSLSFSFSGAGPHGVVPELPTSATVTQ